jgi:K+-sensing histidine kinase KdpD
MLLLQNIEGDTYNPILDNYLVVKVVNYANTAYDELQSLLDLVANSHEELVMVECDSHRLEIFNFMENISRLVVCKVVRKANRYYLTVQKCLF